MWWEEWNIFEHLFWKQFQCAVFLHTVAKGIMVRECLPSVMSAAVLICIMLLKMSHVFCNGCKSAQFITWSSESVEYREWAGSGQAARPGFGVTLTTKYSGVKGALTGIYSVCTQLKGWWAYLLWVGCTFTPPVSLPDVTTCQSQAI